MIVWIVVAALAGLALYYAHKFYEPGQPISVLGIATVWLWAVLLISLFYPKADRLGVHPIGPGLMATPFTVFFLYSLYRKIRGKRIDGPQDIGGRLVVRCRSGATGRAG